MRLDLDALARMAEIVERERRRAVVILVMGPAAWERLRAAPPSVTAAFDKVPVHIVPALGSEWYGINAEGEPVANGTA